MVFEYVFKVFLNDLLQFIGICKIQYLLISNYMNLELSFFGYFARSLSMLFFLKNQLFGWLLLFFESLFH